MTLDELLGRLQGVRQSGGEYMALCPAHADDNASLGVTEKDGRLLLKCFGGCETPDIVQALGIEMRDLFTDARAKASVPKQKSCVVATFSYTDADGVEVYQSRRWEPGFHGKPKSFTRHKPDGRGGYTNGMAGVPKVLYRLPEVLKAVRAGAPVYIAEGEKKADVLAGFGLAGTCNIGGSCEWEASYTETLRGARVFILPDNDSAGMKHLEAVGRALQGVADSIRVVNLPGLPPKGDVVDWVRAGGTREELLSLCGQAEEWEPSAPVTEQKPESLPGSAPDGYPLTDLGNAERLVAAHCDGLRFNVDSGQWLVWDGRRWASDATGRVHRLAREVVRGLYDLLKDCSDNAEQKALFTFIKSSESRPKLEAMVKLAQNCPGIPVQAACLDSDAWLFNCENGTLDLRTGTLREHRQSDLLTKLSPVAYDSAATAERWDRFLLEVFCEDEELAGFTRRMAGYALTGDTREQCFFLLTGKGSNGKSVLVNTLAHIMGDYAKGTPVTTFLERRGDSTSDLASLTGARLVTASEGEGMTAFNESLLKQLTGQDTITARHLYQDFFTFRPSFKVYFATNEVPRIKSQNYAMRRRVKLLPYKQRFYYPHEQKAPVRDESLGEKLRAEASGILAWAVRGCLEWQRDGLGMPGAVQAEVDSLFEGMDVLLDFIEAECELHPRLEVESGDLWRAYLEWCERTKTKQAFKRASDFSRNLCGRDSIESKRTRHARLLSGIGLHGDGDIPPAVTPGDAKTHFPETFPREAHIEKVRENTEMASPGVTHEREEGDGRPVVQGVSTPGKCFHCGGRSFGTVCGRHICYSCYERVYPATVKAGDKK